MIIFSRHYHIRLLIYTHATIGYCMHTIQWQLLYEHHLRLYTCSCCYYCRVKLLDKNSHHLQWSVFGATVFIATQPQFNIICIWLWELLTEPWWVVEGAVSTGTPTSLTIPKWIIRVQYELPSISTSSLTEVVLVNEGRYSSCEGNIWLSTRTTVTESSTWIPCCCKCPYVLPWWLSIC